MDPPAPGAAPRPVTGVPPTETVTDERELVALVLRKDRKAAARFVAAHADAVHAYARQRLAPRADLVDDVVQDVFLAALDGLAAFQGRSSLRGWLIGIARHKIEDIYRQRLRTAEPFDDDVDAIQTEAVPPFPPIDQQIDAGRMQERVRRILATIPERYALMLLWRYWEQRSTRQIAYAIGTTEKSVERTLARARTCFKELWLKE